MQHLRGKKALCQIHSRLTSTQQKPLSAAWEATNRASVSLSSSSLSQRLSNPTSGAYDRPRRPPLLPHQSLIIGPHQSALTFSSLSCMALVPGRAQSFTSPRFSSHRKGFCGPVSSASLAVLTSPANTKSSATKARILDMMPPSLLNVRIAERVVPTSHQTSQTKKRRKSHISGRGRGVSW